MAEPQEENTPDPSAEGEPTDAPPTEKETPADNAGESRFGPVFILDRFMIDADSPLEELNTPSAKAYSVEDRENPSVKLFALVCVPGLPARVTTMDALKGAQIPGLLPLVKWSVAEWPPLGRSTLIVIYEKPLGGRITKTTIAENEETETGLTRNNLAQQMVLPLAEALESLSQSEITHRAIRPDNMFYMDEEKTDVVLGDCVTVPVGFDQPAVFETIEQAMADPGGRSHGDLSNDLFALGVSIISLFMNKSPVAGMSEDEHFTLRFEQGSQAGLCSSDRIPMGMLEILRGLLDDNPENRWDLEQITLWCNGRRQTSSIKRATPKPEAPFSFAGKDFSETRALARAMSMNVNDGAKAIRDGHLEMWLRRTLNQEILADAIMAANETAKTHLSGKQSSDDYLVSKICILLDPEAPLRYRETSLMPEGLGPAMAIEILRKGDPQVSAEIISSGLLEVWISSQDSEYPRKKSLAKFFPDIRATLINNAPGFGAERCLYELNEDLPCQSPQIVNDYIMDVRDILSSLDRASNQASAQDKPLDRHVIAFIAARFDYNITPHLDAFGDAKEERAVIGMLSLLALMQWRLKEKPLLGLASRVGGLLGPAINTYHSRSTRKEIEKAIPRLVRKGSLPELFDLIDNSEKRNEDQTSYYEAQAHFAAAEAEVDEIINGEQSKASAIEQSGQQGAAMTAVILTMVVVTIFFLMEAL
jgi:hypothetical protein